MSEPTKKAKLYVTILETTYCALTAKCVANRMTLSEAVEAAVAAWTRSMLVKRPRKARHE